MKLETKVVELCDPVSGRVLSLGSLETAEKYCDGLKRSGYDYAIAFATEAEVKNGSACGQLALIVG